MEPAESQNSASSTPTTEQLGSNECVSPDFRPSSATSDDHPLKFVVVAVLITLGAIGLVWGLRGPLPNGPAEELSAKASKPPEPTPGSLAHAARNAVGSLLSERGARFRGMNLKIEERHRLELAKSPERQRELEATLVKLAELQDERDRRAKEVKKLREGLRGSPDEKEKLKALDNLVRAEDSIRSQTFDRLYVQLTPVFVHPGSTFEYFRYPPKSP